MQKRLPLHISSGSRLICAQNPNGLYQLKIRDGPAFCKHEHSEEALEAHYKNNATACPKCVLIPADASRKEISKMLLVQGNPEIKELPLELYDMIFKDLDFPSLVAFAGAARFARELVSASGPVKKSIYEKLIFWTFPFLNPRNAALQDYSGSDTNFFGLFYDDDPAQFMTADIVKNTRRNIRNPRYFIAYQKFFLADPLLKTRFEQDVIKIAEIYDLDGDDRFGLGYFKLLMLNKPISKLTNGGTRGHDIRWYPNLAVPDYTSKRISVRRVLSPLKMSKISFTDIFMYYERTFEKFEPIGPNEYASTGITVIDFADSIIRRRPRPEYLQKFLTSCWDEQYPRKLSAFDILFYIEKVNTTAYLWVLRNCEITTAVKIYNAVKIRTDYKNLD